MKMIILIGVMVIFMSQSVLGQEIIDPVNNDKVFDSQFLDGRIKKNTKCSWDGGSNTRDCQSILEFNYSDNILVEINPGSFQLDFNSQVEDLQLSYSETFTLETRNYQNITCVIDERSRLNTMEHQLARQLVESRNWEIIDSFCSLTQPEDRTLFENIQCANQGERPTVTGSIDSINQQRDNIQDTCNIKRSERVWNNFNQLESISLSVPTQLAFKMDFKDTLTSTNGVYNNNHFNISLSVGKNNLFLDPDISACSDLNTPNTFYNLTASVLGNDQDCMIIEANNVTLECNGFNISNVQVGAFGVGVFINGSNDTTVSNCHVSYFDYGLRINDSHFFNVSNYTVFDSVSAGISIEDSTFGNLTDLNNSPGDFLGVAGSILIPNSNHTNITDLYSESLLSLTGSSMNNTIRDVTQIGRMNFDVQFPNNTLDCEWGVIGDGTDTTNTAIVTGVDNKAQNCTIYGFRYGSQPGTNKQQFENIIINQTEEGIRTAMDDGIFRNITINNASLRSINFRDGAENNQVTGFNSEYNISTNVVLFQGVGNNINNTLDCDNGVLQGNDTSTSVGIRVQNNTINESIFNCDIRDFDFGIRFVRANDHTLENVTARSSITNGILLEGARNLTISNVTIIEGSVSNAGILFNFVTDGPIITGSTDNTLYNITVEGGTETLVGVNIATNSDDNNVTRINMLMDASSSTGVAIGDSVNLTIDCEQGTINMNGNSGTEAIDHISGNSINTDNTIRNCRFVNATTGIDLSQNAYGTNYINNLVQNSTTGILTKPFMNFFNTTIINTSTAVTADNDVNFTNTTIANSTIAGFLIASGDNDGLYISTLIDHTEQTVNGIPIDLNSGAIIPSAVQRVNFTGIEINVSGQDGIQLSGNRGDNNFFDCNNNTIEGNDTAGTVGVRLNLGDTNTVQNCVVIDFETGILLEGANTDSNDVNFNTVHNSSSIGIDIDTATSNLNDLIGNSVCFSTTTDADDTNTNNWDNNTCDSTVGGASCNTTCICEPPASGDWLLNASFNCSVTKNSRVRGDVIMFGPDQGSLSVLASFIIDNLRMTCTNCRFISYVLNPNMISIIGGVS